MGVLFVQAAAVFGVCVFMKRFAQWLRFVEKAA